MPSACTQTVIECLKQACTGELPPNPRSGQSFIHDPKVANESEVKAQIRLRFKAGDGNHIVCIRSFQVTQKKNKLEYKALDQTIQTINRDTMEKEAVGHRCVDMDRIVPQLMGVSKVAPRRSTTPFSVLPLEPESLLAMLPTFFSFLV